MHTIAAAIPGLSEDNSLKSRSLHHLAAAMLVPLGAILDSKDCVPTTAALVDDFVHSMAASSTSAMLIAQHAELQRLTAEVGALKSALTARPVAAAVAVAAAAAPLRPPKDSYAARAAKSAPSPPAVPRVPATATPLARHHPGRLILMVKPSQAVRLAVQNASAARAAINTALADLTAARAPHPRLGVSGVSLTRSGNVVVFAMPGLTAADLEPHSALIASAFLPQEAAYTGAARDSVWYKAVVPDVVPPDLASPLPSSQELQAEVEEFVPHSFAWAAPPMWMTAPGRVAEQGSGSVLLSFSREEDLQYVLQNGVFLFGHAMRVRRFRDPGRPRPCSNCCSLEHSSRACSQPPRCGLCSGRHLTSEHSCSECAFFDDAREGLAHCGHTTLCCPHCAGSHAMCDSACRVWSRRPGAPPRRVRRKRGGGQEGERETFFNLDCVRRLHTETEPRHSSRVTK